MKKAFFFVLVFLPTCVLAQDNAATPATASPVEAVDVDGLLTNLKNPFESKLPPPPPPPEPVGITNTINSGMPQQVVNTTTQGVAQIVKPVVQKPNLSVIGLVWSDKINAAIINGHVLGIGDEINGARIRRISREGVTVVFQGIEFSYGISDIPGSAGKNMKK